MAWMRQQIQKPEVFGTGGTTPCEKTSPTWPGNAAPSG
jgi:hypothetical protein